MTSSKAVDRASVASSSEKGTLAGVPARRKDPATSQSFTQPGPGKNNLDPAREKPSNVGSALTRRTNADKKQAEKFGDSRPGAATSRTLQAAKRHNNTAQPAESGKLADPSSSDAPSQAKVGMLPGLRRTTT